MGGSTRAGLGAGRTGATSTEGFGVVGTVDSGVLETDGTGWAGIMGMAGTVFGLTVSGLTVAVSFGLLEVLEEFGLSDPPVVPLVVAPVSGAGVVEVAPLESGSGVGKGSGVGGSVPGAAGTVS